MTGLKKENNPNSDANNLTVCSGTEGVYKSFTTHTKVLPISIPWGTFSPETLTLFFSVQGAACLFLAT
jgi:hypothetical protein